MHKRYQHPEALEDEIFYVNIEVKSYFGGRVIMFTNPYWTKKWKTKRLGGISYDCHGKQLEGYRPMFIKREEAEKDFSINEVGPIVASYYPEE